MIHRIIERVRFALTQPGVTPGGLAKRAGLHPNTLYGAESEHWNPKLNTLIALEPHLPDLPALPTPDATQEAA